MPLPLVIDSGAFSAWSKKEEIDFEDYIDFCHEVYEMFPNAVFVNLDVIGKGKESYENWRTMISAGVDALPIYHMSTDIRWLEKYLEHTNHIGLGALADKAVRAKRQVSLDRMWRDYFLNGDKMPTTRVHGMGVTSFPLIKRYPWHSVDSTSWLQVGQFGYIFIPRRTGNGDWDFTSMPLKIGFSTQCSAKKDRHQHYDNLSKHEKENLHQYLKDYGFKLGTSKFVKGIFKAVKRGKVWKITGYKKLGRKRKNKDTVTKATEVVIEEGVSNYHGKRNELTVEYFNAFVRDIPWPRPFTGSMGGLRGSNANDKPCVEDNIEHTLLYLSGSAYPIENYIMRNQERMDHLGILLSYYDMQTRGSTWKRLLSLKEKA